MDFSSVLCILLCISATAVTKDDLEINKVDGRLTNVDPLLEAVQLEKWDHEEMPCLEATLAVLHGVKNSTLWATWIWDSMQQPTGFFYGSQYQLGSFDQCIQPPWLHSHPYLRTQYCLADVHLSLATPKKYTGPLDPYSTTDLYFGMTSKYGRYLNVLTWGVCLPSECSQRSIRKLVQVMVRTQHLSPNTPEPHITVDSCQLAGESVEYSYEFYAFLLLSVILTMTSMLATFRSGSETKNSSVNCLLSCFDLNKNWKGLVQVQKGEIKTLNGLKFLSTGTTIVAHYLYYKNQPGIINGLEIDRDLETGLGILMTRVDIVIDTFLFISGLLLMKGLISGKRKDPLTGLIKRYIRMAFPLAVIIFYLIAVHKYTGSGPLWRRFSWEQQDFCKTTWWMNLLMMTNYSETVETCYITTWYISCDFQLAIVGSLLFYIYQKNIRLGKRLFLATMLITLLIPVLVTYRNEIPVTLFHDIQKLIDLNSNETYFKLYVRSDCRALVYLLGMMMGYWMSFYKPEDYRNTVTKKWSIVGAAIAFTIMHKVMREGGMFVHKDYDLMEAITYVALHKIGWSIAIASLIAVCEYGYVPIVSYILQMRPWEVLSKLCYIHYLINMIVIYRHAHLTRSPVTYDFFEMVFNGVGIVFTIVPISLYLYMFVEVPAGNLANFLFGSKSINIGTNTSATKNYNTTQHISNDANHDVKCKDP